MDKIEKAIRRSITAVAKEFRDCGANFLHESDLQGTLFRHLSMEPDLIVSVESDHKTYHIRLARQQWPWILKDPESKDFHKLKGWYDLVVWDPQEAEHTPGVYWPLSNKRQGIEIQLHTVIEIKHRRAALTPPDDWAVVDFIKLKDALKRKAQSAYYLVFIDHDMKPENEEKFATIRNGLKRMKGRRTNLNVAMVVRSGSRKVWL